MAELIEVELETVVRDARAGDARALGRLYDSYRDRVARFAAGRLGDAEKAEDVTSETFEAVCRNLASYRATCS
jgi:DNA-directed RNA polymerase specialized sigma24 family protein